METPESPKRPSLRPLWIGLGICAAIVYAITPSSNTSAPLTPAASIEAATAKAAADQMARWNANKPTVLAASRAKLAQGDGDGAIEALNGYFGVKDPDFDNAHRDGALMKYRKQLTTTKPTDFHQLADTLRVLNRLDPDDKTVAAALVKAEARLESNRKAENRERGVVTGMTMAEVLESSWGNPESRNVTQSASHSHEQWVYGNRNYLYFDDGILRTIQTTH